MQVVQGIYDNGTLKLDRKAPMSKSRVIVLFTEEYPRKKMPVDEALRILHKYAGSIKNSISLEEAKDEYFNEKHGVVN